ncbi:MAG: type II secretion system minor pseudopilin GspK [Gammaproteobacteria bacterium]|nr:type II secretion system minor pseudopilin GspK [Gammaproteobacteria bacterium]MDH5630949.1 type II secretion system minor pseudopilin GspK [Gammaproteobacteria bacterium]
MKAIDIGKTGINNWRKQNGAILITVVLISAFMAMVLIRANQIVSYQKQLGSNIQLRDKAMSYLSGLEEFAKISLKKSFEDNKESTVHLNQDWASQGFSFPIEGGMMSATIKDMQSCFNLNSIIHEDQQGANNNQPNANFGFAKPTGGQEIFADLIHQTNEDAGLNTSGLAAVVRDWIDPDMDVAGPDGAEDNYYQSLEIPYRVSNNMIAHPSELLAMKDFNRAIYNGLRSYICTLPDKTVNKININTVTSENSVLIYAVLNAPNLTLEQVNNAIGARPDEGFGNIAEFLQELGQQLPKDVKEKADKFLTVNSHYFEMTGTVIIGKNGETKVVVKTLLKRDNSNNFEIIGRYFGKE